MKQFIKYLIGTCVFICAINVGLIANSATIDLASAETYADATPVFNQAVAGIPTNNAPPATNNTATADTGAVSPNIVTSASNPALTNAPEQPVKITNANGTLSFDFQDIDIRTLLQLIAKNSNLNFIISDTVKGSITLSLKNVTWERALDIILKARGLTARRVGNVIMISTIEEITSNESKQLQSDEALINLAPLQSKIIHLKYASATDVATLLKGAQSQLLTPRGQVAVDTHTNSIIVRDTFANLSVIEKEIHQLDIPAKQVFNRSSHR